MKLTIDTAPYNSRRYGKPWIALVTFDSASKAQFAFGSWVGGGGEAGVLEIDAQPGQIVARGQKDYRKNKNSAPYYYIVTEDGGCDDGGHVTKARAYAAYRDDLVARLRLVETMLAAGEAS